MVEGNYVNIWKAEARFVGDGRDCLLGSLSSIFWSSLTREGVQSPWGALHWISNFVSPNNKKPRVVAMPVTVYTKDLILMGKKDHLGPTMTLEQTQHQLVQPEEAEEARTSYQSHSFGLCRVDWNQPSQLSF